jgi:hypothetical protein
MNLSKVGWVLSLTAIFLAGCGTKDECDTTELVNDLNQVDGQNLINFHDMEANDKIAQKFQPSRFFTLANAAFTIMKVGDPQGDLRISIRDADGNEPDDSAITDGGPVVISTDTIGDDGFLTEVKVEFEDHPDLNSGATYFLVIDSTGVLDSENYYQLGSASDGNAYPNGEVWRYNSDPDIEEWSSSSEDLQFHIRECIEED